MRIAIFGKEFKAEFRKEYQQIVDILERNKVQIVVFKDLYHKMDGVNFNSDIQFFASHDELVVSADVLFSIGGDGTILGAVTYVRDSNIPILGINIGRLGFLSSVSKEEIEIAIQNVLSNNYILDRRSLLHLESNENLFGDLNFALNELTIQKSDNLAMIVVHVYVDDHFVNSYWSDGLIIATPTGSTAYSLSCQGPIVEPNSKNFILTPIATHNLTVRPMVLSDSSVIKLKVSGRSKQFMIGLDSRYQHISSHTELIVRKGKFTVNLVQMPSKNFYNTIREKLNWGRDMRN